MNNIRIIDMERFGSTELYPKSHKLTKMPLVEEFSTFLMKELKKINELQLNADDMSKKLATGELQNVHQLTIAVAKADIALRLVTEIRNKLVDAYQQISRMTM